jgi:hypothetical protein
LPDSEFPVAIAAGIVAFLSAGKMIKKMEPNRSALRTTKSLIAAIRGTSSGRKSTNTFRRRIVKGGSAEGLCSRFTKLDTALILL